MRSHDRFYDLMELEPKFAQLRAVHGASLESALGIVERDQWLACMRRALDDTGVDAPVAEALMDAFFQTADWMRNQ